MRIDSDTRVLVQQLMQMIATTADPVQCASQVLQIARDVTSASGACLALFGETPLTITDGDVECHRAGLEALAAELAPGFHATPLLSDGTTLYEDYHLIASIRDEAGETNFGAFTLIFHDPTAPIDEETLPPLLDAVTIIMRELLNQAHRASAEQLTTSILASITDPLFVIDENQAVVLLNPAAEKLFQTSAEAACGQFLGDIIRSDTLMKLVGDANRRQAEWVAPDGEMIFVPRTEPIHNPDGSIEGWVLSLRDITHYKKLVRNQNEFTRIVAHDLRSPLTSMQGFANMLELELVGELNEKQAHFVEKILSGITQMTALVENIQDAGRYDPETGFYELNRSHCDLSDIVKRIVDNHLVPAEKQELELTWGIADNVPIINADMHMLERAITNLIDNAIKYTPNGGSINVNIDKDQDQILISVADTGYGISPENQKHLFERHVRIARREHKQVKGSGLGLFIVRSVARRHGGDAWVRSAEGEGSTFTMSIPLSGGNLVAG